MQTSSKKLSSQQQQTITQQFVTLLTDLKYQEESQAFFNAFLTKTEQSVFAKRLGIVWMLHQGKSYEDIKRRLKVSSATISSVAAQMKNNDTQIIVDKLRVEDWAQRWANKLTNWVSLPQKRK